MVESSREKFRKSVKRRIEKIENEASLHLSKGKIQSIQDDVKDIFIKIRAEESNTGLKKPTVLKNSI